MLSSIVFKQTVDTDNIIMHTVLLVSLKTDNYSTFLKIIYKKLIKYIALLSIYIL